ncbi:hypothetical protein BDV06DRAFT_201523 [Aspergillus oleicola]
MTNLRKRKKKPPLHITSHTHHPSCAVLCLNACITRRSVFARPRAAAVSCTRDEFSSDHFISFELSFHSMPCLDLYEWIGVLFMGIGLAFIAILWASFNHIMRSNF